VQCKLHIAFLSRYVGRRLEERHVGGDAVFKWFYSRKATQAVMREVPASNLGQEMDNPNLDLF
jgi:hypothetical protein